MRLSLPLLAAVCLSTAALAAPPPAAPAKASPFPALRTRYLDGLFRAKPHMATYMGDHRHDGELPDLSEKAVGRRVAELEDQQKALRRLNISALSADERTDAAIMADGIALELLELREIREWTWNPRLHDSFTYYDPRELIAERLTSLIHGTFAPEAIRRKSVVSELLALPRFLDQEKKALVTPSKVHLDQAIKDNQGRIEFFNTEVKPFVQKDPAGEKARQAAVAALEAYQTFLEKELPARATRDWRLGADLYAKKFPLALQTTLKPEETSARADAAFKAARAELYQVALKLHQELWPSEAAPAADAPTALQAKVIFRVRDEIAKDHPKRDELVQASAAKLDSLRTFIEQKDLLVLPPKDTLAVEAMPAFKRGSSGAEYLSPGMLDKTFAWKGTFYVDPVEPGWPQEKAESYLRANNDYEVALTAAHEAYPGHHVQAWYSRKDLDPLRATLWNGSMAEGWAVYGTTLITKLGYGGDKNDRYRFDDLIGAMIVAANAVLDVKLQSGQLSDEEALRYMVQDGFQEQAQAQRKLLRAKLDSTQLCQYFLGYSELEELEREVRQRDGQGFTQRRFDEEVIGHGSIAVKHLRGYLLPSK